MLKIGAYYKHYKGGIYQVLGTFTNLEGIDEVIYTDNHKYVPIFKQPPICQKGITFHRPLVQWHELVKCPDPSGARFGAVIISRYLLWDPSSDIHKMQTPEKWENDRLQANLTALHLKAARFAKEVVGITGATLIGQQRAYTALSKVNEAALKFIREM